MSLASAARVSAARLAMRPRPLRPPAFAGTLARRWQSTVQPPAAEVPLEAALPASDIPAAMPSAPFVGSVPWAIKFEFSDGTKRHAFQSWLHTLPELRRRHGPVYRMGLPGLGNPGSPSFIINDPREWMKILRSEGSHPFGGVESTWPLRTWLEARQNPTRMLMGNGEEWKRMRVPMQRDLLAPKPAAGYVPCMAEAAMLASKAAASQAADMEVFLSRASFDLFSAILLGRSMGAATGSGRDVDLKFCEDTLNALRMSTPMQQDLWEILCHKVFKVETAKLTQLMHLLDEAFFYARDCTKALIAKRDAAAAGGPALTSAEANSYLIQSLEHRDPEKDNITEDELKEVILLTLFASVDTTASLIGWCFVQLAKAPHVQEKLRAELTSVLGDRPADSAELLDRTSLPYLNAVIRETHRVSPSVPMFPKITTEDLVIAGRRLPAGSPCLMDTYGLCQDESIVGPDVREFKPERWLPEAVAARQGTPQEIMDHRLLATPFSAGARKCPGSRVASLELRCFLATFIRDWRISLAPGEEEHFDGCLPRYKQGTTIVPAPMPRFELSTVAKE